MDYIDIILKGYTNENDKKFFSKYFIRESKKAEKEHYDFEEFFTGLLNGIKTLKMQYEKPLYKRKNELYFMLEGAENGTLKYGELKNESIEERNKKTIEYCNSELSQITFENYPINLLHLTNDRFRGNLFYREVIFIESEISEAYNKLIEVQKPNKAKRKIKGVLTNETYYNVLEKCTIEAFECLTVKDHYPKNGAKAIWDTSSLTITKGDGLPTEKDNELFSKEYVKENMRVTFLTALNRFWKDFEVKHSITREFFYKKCYQSLLFKVFESPLWEKPDFGIDINNPCKLTFIWNMRRDIEARSIEPQNPTPEAIQQQNEINQYIQSYKHSFFSSLLNKRNEDGKENILFYGKRTVDLLNRRDKKLISKENLRDRYNLLNLYNSHLNNLINHIIQLYKAINGYNDTSNTGYLAIIKLNKDKIFNSLQSIKGFSENINDEVICGNKEKAIIIKTYFVSELDVLIAFLDDTIGIDIYKSPLQTNFEAVKFALNSSINLEELKFINQLNTIVTEQPENDNPAVDKEITFKNQFDKVLESKIIEYFTKNLVEKKYLTAKTLDEYLKQAFELKTPPKQKFSFVDIESKEIIVKVFYKYYKDLAGKTYGKQPEYLNLLKDYFTGFEKINLKNFSK